MGAGTVTCPSCSQSVVPPAHYIGKTWRCPACRERFVPTRAGADGELVGSPPPAALIPDALEPWARRLGWALVGAIATLLLQRLL